MNTLKQQNDSSSLEISLVIPVYNERDSLDRLTNWIHEAIGSQYRYEIIFVDDGSTDGSWDEIDRLGQEHGEVSGIRFRRNYGKSTALQSGFDHATGQYVVTMDSDLQDDPHEIPEMIQMIKEEGYDLVSGWKKKRHDPINKTIPSRFFNFVTSLVTDIKLHDFNCGLKAYRREAVENIELYGELHRYIPLLVYWEGFDKIGEKVVKHHPREFGKTKFGFSRFINGFLDLLTLIFVNNYLQRPMHFFGTIGLLLMIVGGAVNAYLAGLKIFYDEALSNRPLLFLGVLLMVVGVQFFSTGFLGEMINKNRNSYVEPNIEEKKGFGD